jgi:transcriptional regulator with XRE-family HTH domain
MPSHDSQKVIDEVSTPIGERVKALRLDRGLTLSEVAERASVSTSNLSKIERGDVSPSFDIVMRICSGLGVAIEQIVKPGPKIDVSGRKTVTHRGEAVAFSSPQYDYQAHSIEISRKNMIPLEMWVSARSPEDFAEWSQHGGEEFIYVIEGSIEVHTDQYAPFVLLSGESAYFDSSMKHVYVSVGEGSAHILSISYDGRASERASLESFLNPGARSHQARRVVRVGATKAGPAKADEKSLRLKTKA